MRFQPWRLGLLPASLLVVAACASGTRRTTQDLYDRMSVSLAPDIQAGQATLRPLQSGVAVTLVGDRMFMPGRSELNEDGSDVLTRVIQALLDPTLLRIEVAQATATPGGLQAARVQTVAQYLNLSSIWPSAQAPVPMRNEPSGPAGAPFHALTITVNVISS
jgi:hypothetical protein